MRKKQPKCSLSPLIMMIVILVILIMMVMMTIIMIMISNNTVIPAQASTLCNCLVDNNKLLYFYGRAIFGYDEENFDNDT